jgi:hypothetical protein
MYMNKYKRLMSILSSIESKTKRTCFESITSCHVVHKASNYSIRGVGIGTNIVDVVVGMVVVCGVVTVINMAMVDDVHVGVRVISSFGR